MSRQHPRRARHPESLMMGYGYVPEWSEGAIKPPLFLTSTFVFKTAEEGEAYFRQAYGLDPETPDQPMGLIYSRLNNPVLEILEDRLRVWEEAEGALSFASGMAAISTAILALCRPGDQIVYTIPVYGGTDYFFRHIAPAYELEAIPVEAGPGFAERVSALKLERPRFLFVETPANPTTTMTDIAEAAELARTLRRPAPDGGDMPDAGACLLAVDNTFLGPVWQQPILLGADLSLYSATKFIGGHSDLIAGAVLGRRDLIERIRVFRTIMGSMSEPFSAWLMLRSLETLRIRMEAQQRNAIALARFLAGHPAVARVHYPGLLDESSQEGRIYQRQCRGPGSLIAFEMKKGEDKAAAFRVLNRLGLAHLAVSLGGTETLAEHPATMTHADVPPEEQRRAGITPGMIRVSCGVEHIDDLIADFRQALDPEI
ncbi:MAG: aminotransferase class I/II-fold pyridoxal phosphate-dependent enzyme [Acidobacteria bacterium]|nr:MAG: aminotransferase class I/II-fold pyridoxal phosphate-dependent enzyme [Acidobacteriota bacterium]